MPAPQPSRSLKVILDSSSTGSGVAIIWSSVKQFELNIWPKVPPSIFDMDKPQPRRPLVSISASDPLKHFSRDGPLVKLAALLISRAHVIIWSMGIATAAVTKALGQW